MTRNSQILRGISVGDAIGGPSILSSHLWDSLRALGRFEPNDVLQRYLAWWEAGGFDTGPVAAEAFSRISAGVSPDQAVAAAHEKLGGMTAGIGPAHRSTVLADAGFLAFDDLADCARAEARLTHWHPLAGDVAAACAELARLLLEGEPWGQVIDRCKDGKLKETAEAARQWQLPPKDISGYSVSVLHAALHFVGTSGSIVEALERAAQFAGAANYAPVLVGALACARWGHNNSPPDCLRDDRN
jgi:ADP-ribosylglycohydrolase